MFDSIRKKRKEILMSNMLHWQNGLIVVLYISYFKKNENSRGKFVQKQAKCVGLYDVKNIYSN